MTRPPAGPALVTVAVTEREVVVARGHQRTSWLIREGNGWRPASDAPSASVTLLEPAPGTVWERTIDLALAPGTLLMRVDSRPAPPRRRDPLEHLRREERLAPRMVRRQVFAVDRRGALVPEASAGTPAVTGAKGAPRR